MKRAFDRKSKFFETKKIVVLLVRTICFIIFMCVYNISVIIVKSFFYLSNMYKRKVIESKQVEFYTYTVHKFGVTFFQMKTFFYKKSSMMYFILCKIIKNI